jgi:glycosyltransferase involved in cell wall biosynthesis
MHRILFVSRQFPGDIARSVHGIYLRMRAFAGACVELLKDPARCEAMGLRARQAVEQRYDRKHIVARIKGTIGEEKTAWT